MYTLEFFNEVINKAKIELEKMAKNIQDRHPGMIYGIRSTWQDTSPMTKLPLGIYAILAPAINAPDEITVELQVFDKIDLTSLGSEVIWAKEFHDLQEFFMEYGYYFSNGESVCESQRILFKSAENSSEVIKKIIDELWIYNDGQMEVLIEALKNI